MLYAGSDKWAGGHTLFRLATPPVRRETAALTTAREIKKRAALVTRLPRADYGFARRCGSSLKAASPAGETERKEACVRAVQRLRAQGAVLDCWQGTFARDDVARSRRIDWQAGGHARVGCAPLCCAVLCGAVRCSARMGAGWAVQAGAGLNQRGAPLFGGLGEWVVLLAAGSFARWAAAATAPGSGVCQEAAQKTSWASLSAHPFIIFHQPTPSHPRKAGPSA